MSVQDAHVSDIVTRCIKKNINVPRLSEHPPVRGGIISKRLDGIICCKDKKLFMTLNRVPEW